MLPHPVAEQRRSLRLHYDGNVQIDDACINCVPAACGDGYVWAGVEECDTGPNLDNEGLCEEDCTDQVCGDGFVGPGESCDDGNSVDGDGCDSD